MSQQRQTPTHTECDTDLHHNAHTHTQDNGRGTSAQYTPGRTAGKIYITPHTETHCYTPPLHRPTLCTHIRTRTHARAGNGNGGAMVKSGNIKVDLRSGVALLQERTRTHARTSNRILYKFPCLLCVLFPCRFSLPLLCRFLTLFCRGF